MTDPRREGTGGRGARTTAGSTGKSATGAKSGADDSRKESRTAGTNRDFDETQESENQGHGHPREDRGTRD